jgi:hypothetical protein
MVQDKSSFDGLADIFPKRMGFVDHPLRAVLPLSQTVAAFLGLEIFFGAAHWI